MPRSLAMLAVLILGTVLLLGSASSALAHGIAGNRYFPDTLTFDDPAVAEVSRPGESHPQALAEPYMNVSTHTAPIIQPSA